MALGAEALGLAVAGIASVVVAAGIAVAAAGILILSVGLLLVFEKQSEIGYFLKTVIEIG